jgi:3-oxoacyl-[acyl-carrier protein] reductase
MRGTPDLKGLRVAVTGGTSGLGLALVRQLSEQGARVALVARTASSVKQTAEEAGAYGIVGNVGLKDDIYPIALQITGNLGGLDVLINNAGFTHRSGPAWELDEADYDRVFATNTKGVWLGVKYAVPVMRVKGGVIVNTASIGAVAPRPGVTVYNATKGAVVTMTRGLAVELARFNIRVNAVNPVAADTPFMRGALGGDSLPDANRAALIAGIPLRRLTEPTDVAAAVTFLASDDAAFLTGVCLPVDGGRSIS